MHFRTYDTDTAICGVKCLVRSQGKVRMVEFSTDDAGLVTCPDCQEVLAKHVEDRLVPPK